jgi:hypothetical protein
MSKKTFDFTEVQEFELKTPAGDTVLREPSPQEYFDYLKELKVEGRELTETYELYVDYFAKLGGDEKVIRSLTLNQMFDVVQSVNGADIEKK